MPRRDLFFRRCLCCCFCRCRVYKSTPGAAGQAGGQAMSESPHTDALTHALTQSRILAVSGSNEGYRCGQPPTRGSIIPRKQSKADKRQASQPGDGPVPQCCIMDRRMLTFYTNLQRRPVSLPYNAEAPSSGDDFKASPVLRPVQSQPR